MYNKMYARRTRSFSEQECDPVTVLAFKLQELKLIIHHTIIIATITTQTNIFEPTLKRARVIPSVDISIYNIMKILTSYIIYI